MVIIPAVTEETLQHLNHQQMVVKVFLHVTQMVEMAALAVERIKPLQVETVAAMEMMDNLVKHPEELDKELLQKSSKNHLVNYIPVEALAVVLRE